MSGTWQKDFFRGVAVEFWRRVMTPEQTRSEADFLEKVLEASRGARLLDVPCGHGRHAIELAHRGYRMTGLDSSEDALKQAREATSVPIEWTEADMCELPWTAEFDGAYCFGNSFGYLNAPDAQAFLSAVANTLKAGARFVVDTGMAAESILPGRVKTRWFRSGDIFMLSENQYHPAEGRLDIEYTFIQGGGIDTRSSASYTFTTAEICRMHSRAGLEPVQLLASTAGEPYQLGSPRLLLVSRKQPPG
jgi:SAM-dependent methyltransferase